MRKTTNPLDEVYKTAGRQFFERAKDRMARFILANVCSDCHLVLGVTCTAPCRKALRFLFLHFGEVIAAIAKWN